VGLSSVEISALGTQQIAGFTLSQINALNNTQLTAIDSLSSGYKATFNPTVVAGLSTNEQTLTGL
jgi:hypothetical protein